MIDSTYLPHPLPSEVEGFNKASYFNRLYVELDYSSKVKLPGDILVKWIHQNFDSVKLHNLPLTYGQFKKTLQ